MADQKKFLDLPGLQVYHNKIKELLNNVNGVLVADDSTLVAAATSSIIAGKPVFYEPADGANILLLDQASSPVRHFGITTGTSPAFVTISYANYNAGTSTLGQGIITTVVDSATLQAAKDYADSLGVNYDSAGTAETKVQQLASGQVATNTQAIATLNGNDTTAGSVAKQVKDAKDALEAMIGTLANLETTAKGDLVSAINEVRQSIEAGGTGSVVTMTTETTTEGMAKSYTIKQGDSLVGVIDIPKDMVVSSGTVVTNPEDQPPGTYIVLTLANATADKIYINVGTLVDIYTVQGSATQVQLAINSETREISATIVAGSITANELAANAVTTVKIADGNVTKAKLETTVRQSLDKADSALQESAITTGTSNGTIAVNGNDVEVKGLGGAAYKAETDFDAAGAADEVYSAIIPITTEEIQALFTE